MGETVHTFTISFTSNCYFVKLVVQDVAEIICNHAFDVGWDVVMVQ